MDKHAETGTEIKELLFLYGAFCAVSAHGLFQIVWYADAPRTAAPSEIHSALDRARKTVSHDRQIVRLAGC